jgi:hypothetical protein
MSPASAKFPAGRIVATPGALASLTHDDITSALARHLTGDWGEVTPHDRQENEFSLTHELRLFSIYSSAAGVRFYIITESDRSVTTLLLPEDY